MVKQVMWVAGMSAVLMACLMAAHDATGAVVVPEADQQFAVSADGAPVVRTLRFAPGDERTLDIRLIHGSIRVTESADATVRLEVRRSTRAESDSAARLADGEVAADILDNATTVGVVVRERGNSVCGERSEQRSTWQRPRYRVTFAVTVAVPKGTRLRLCTINGGDIRVDRSSGDFDVSHVNGSIAMNEASGSGRAETVNGNVTAAFSQTPRTASSFKTINGDVAVTFPASLSADLALKTFNGGLFTDFDVQPLARQPSSAERLGSRFVYRSNDFTHVRVAGGGPEFTFESLNGDVRVVRAAR
jgi:hypothetical protein